MSDQHDGSDAPAIDDDAAGPMIVAGDNPASADAYLLLLPDVETPERFEPPSGTPVPAGEGRPGPASEPVPESRPEPEPSQFA